ncbi:MAG: hypothetical protein Q4F67_13960 [Propionibacteriaceae bacterium]|nr:hypothetical protein [Propionibacteriaceae bacterium]
MMGVPIRRFDSLDELAFDTAEPARYVITDSEYSLPLDALFYPRPDSNRLLVGLHGAEPRGNSTLPKFQFVRSFLSRTESLLFVSDSTLLQGPDINIGWYAGNRDTPLVDLMALAAKKAGATVNAEETILVGHSAGGFAAVLMGSRIPNSRAISVNGQTVVERYFPWAVSNLQTFAFPECENPAEMVLRYGNRLDLRIGLEHRLETASFTHFGNRSDPSSFGERPHFTLLAEHFGLTELGGITAHGDALVACDWGTQGSGHAMPGSAIPFLNLVLDEGQPSEAITHDVDPRWHR